MLDRLWHRSTIEEALFCGFCIWALFIQMHFRVPGQFVFVILPWIGLVLTVISVLSLSVQIVAYAPTKDPLRRDLRLFQQGGRLVLGGFVLYGVVLYVNCAFDMSSTVGQKSIVLDLSDGEFDVGRFMPYTRADLQSWRTPGATEQVFVNWQEKQSLWTKEAVLVEVHEGLLGISWISAVKKDEEAHLLQVLKIVPTAASAWRQLVWWYLNEKRWDEAVKTANEYFRYYPDDAQTFSGFADTLFMYRQFGAAIKVLEPLLAHRPHFKVYQLAAWTLGQGGKADDKVRALELAKAMVAMEADNPVSYYTLAHVYYWKGQRQEALMAFEKLLTLWPEAPEVEQIVEELRKSPGSGT
jgi:hypothetical protein